MKMSVLVMSMIAITALSACKKPQQAQPQQADQTQTQDASQDSSQDVSQDSSQPAASSGSPLDNISADIANQYLGIYTDSETHCQYYMILGNTNEPPTGMIPRLNSEGQPMCGTSPPSS